MRNIENRLSSLPSVNIGRTKFNMPPFHVLGTMNVGKLVPILYQEVLPGSTYSLTVKELVRMSTPIKPVMDDCYLDTYFFFVPNRLSWRHWVNFMGENDRGYWTNNQQTYTVPMLKCGSVSDSQVAIGSVADKFGLPVGVPNIEFSQLPFRDYVLIWNEWFRDQNTMDPAYVNLDDSDDSVVGDLSSPAKFTAALGGSLLPVAKFHDYFTTSLPEPQRGSDVSLPLGELAPLVTGPTYDGVTPHLEGAVGDIANAALYVASDGSLAASPSTPITGVGIEARIDNVYADLSDATAATINQLRLAVAVQSFYEASARYGARYTELLRGHFGVISPDARLQRPEYIGGRRTKINMQQVLQTSSTDSESPQGNTAAFSLTQDVDKSFTYSAVEHGYIIGVCCVRTKQSYQYGIERSWSRKDMLDFYFPEFAHIGEQPVLNKEIYATGTSRDDEVFGYQEAWAEYRQKFSSITGSFRSNAPQSLDFWHYAEDYNSPPTLSEEFMIQSSDPVDRTLAVSSELEDQFLYDFCFDMTAVLPIPMNSIPGFGVHL